MNVRRQRNESGQTVVEFALVMLLVLTLTVGILDVGLGFYQYNAISALAQESARWASVEGGTCAQAGAASTSDFCNQNGGSILAFWSQTGNSPLQGAGVSCPSYTSTPADYYTVSNFTGNGGTTIVGTIATHFDSNSSSIGFVSRKLNSTFDLAKLKVCISVTSSTLPPLNGDAVAVSLYYPFTPVTRLWTDKAIALTAVSQYQVE